MTSPWTVRKRRGGFTLIEVIGALVIFAFGIVIATQLAGSLSLQVELSALRSEVVAHAQARLEEMDRRPYDSLGVGADVDTITIRGKTFLCTTVVSDYASRIRSVEVSVQPADSVGPSHTLTSYVYEPW